MGVLASEHDVGAGIGVTQLAASDGMMRSGEEREWSRTERKRRPLGFLDLPIDILQNVLSQTTHTNDLCALALTHSSLHVLVVPYIYSRFDIVWPEANPTVESRVGVDALTYGLSTLVMAHDVFGEHLPQQPCRSCQHCSKHKPRSFLQSGRLPTRLRRGNYFARYTRKFSLGNGPTDWVSEYLITKEGGKMLGTLVALALGRMHNLESFVWDMPTGVLRDVWIALASLANRQDGQDCRLEKIWVRWHDNRDVAPLPREARQHTLPTMLHGTASSLFYIPPYPTVEHPTFSILPALRSINVLDIDELPYAEELSILIERSLDRLQELRIGVAAYAQRFLAFRPVDDRSVVPPDVRVCDLGANPGGILGVLVNSFCQPFVLAKNPAEMDVPASNVPQSETASAAETRGQSLSKHDSHLIQNGASDVNHLSAIFSAQTLDDGAAASDVSPPQRLSTTISSGTLPCHIPYLTHGAYEKSDRERGRRRMKLTILELERVYLSIPVLSKSLDWTRLESLTLLGCMNHEELWLALQREFRPASCRQSTPMARFASGTPRHHRTTSSFHHPPDRSEYKLKIRRLHTDTVSKHLLDFIKTTLAPDSLEWLFLQRTTAYHSTVKIEEIYRSAIRRHRGSLRKLLIDSEYRNLPRYERERPEREPQETHWQEWMLNEEILGSITSGKMFLRELSMSIDHRQWHYFLQRLPNATTLRSLHVAHIANHPNGRHYDREEIARSLLNIIVVRPEIELCYFGIEKKCYEILEYNSQYVRPASPTRDYIGTIGITTHTSVEDDYEEDPDHDNVGTLHQIDHIEPETFSDDEDNDTSSNTSSRTGDTYDEDDARNHDMSAPSDPVFKLREILFYDDKITIFKARHGKL